MFYKYSDAILSNVQIHNDTDNEVQNETPVVIGAIRWILVSDRTRTIKDEHNISHSQTLVCNISEFTFIIGIYEYNGIYTIIKIGHIIK